jgi:transglutaminase-like putative cysteine protease
LTKLGRGGDAGGLSATHADDAVRDVGCELTFEVTDEVVLALQVAPATTAGRLVDERLDVTIDDRPPREPVVEVAASHGGRTHVVRTSTGTLHVAYQATISGPVAAPSSLASPSTSHVAESDLPLDQETIVALRQSRYCPSDSLAGFAAGELAGLDDGPDLASAIASWVFERLAYELGVSGPLDSAVDSLLANAGACRDFAHVTIALCRARGVPARLAAVYAPGLSPMDFHAVVEVRRGRGWEVLDPTRLAPRPSLVRIATGRDAADTAFATTLRGEVKLVASEVHASIEGDLPLDDHRAAMPLL